DAEILPRELRRVLDGGDLDGAVADADRIALHLHVGREAALHGVETQQVRIGLDRREVVDGDDLDIPASGFDDRAQREAADATKAIDGDTNGHCWLLVARR